jgi:methyl-accepting chemotaxis protein
LSSGVTEQAAALQETVSSLDEIQAMVTKNADNAQSAQAIAASGVSEAEGGRAAVRDVMAAIEAIQKTTEAFDGQVAVTSQQLSEITKVIAEIGGKTKVIELSPMKTQGWTVSAMWAAASYLSDRQLKEESPGYLTPVEIARLRGGMPRPNPYPAT